jgi:hypothetical protein
MDYTREPHVSPDGQLFTKVTFDEVLSAGADITADVYIGNADYVA